MCLSRKYSRIYVTELGTTVTVFSYLMKAHTNSPSIAHEMTISSPLFLVTKNAEGVPPQQFIRELTHNSIQADATEIRWEQDKWWASQNPDDGAKLCISDNGKGMSATKLKAYIGSFASSGGTQSSGANYGVGAKFAAAKFSPTGLYYRTWEDGVGSCCRLVMDLDRGVMGLADLGNGIAIGSVSLQDAPPEIRRTGHGTVVTLLGKSAEDETIECPDKLAGGQYWVGQQLARRYFVTPSNVKIFIGGREAVPQEAYLNSICSDEKKGVVEVLDDYEVYWWLLDERDHGKSGAREQINAPVAQFGILHRDLEETREITESYEVKCGAQSRHVMQRFGIRAGADRIAIYVKPKRTANPTTNIQRTRVELSDSNDVPLDIIADAFVENMPNELAQYIYEKTAHATFDLTKLSDELTKDLEDMGVGRYRRDAQGRVFVDRSDVAGLIGPSDSGSSQGGGSGSGGSSGQRTGTQGDAGESKSSGDRARALRIQIPDVILCSDDENIGDSVRLSDVDPRIKDRAALYVGRTSTKPCLYINLDFRGYKKLEETLAAKRLTPAEAKRPALVRPALLPVYVRGILEAVVTAQVLSTENTTWSADDREAIFSPEALTLAALQRQNTLNVARQKR